MKTKSIDCPNLIARAWMLLFTVFTINIILELASHPAKISAPAYVLIAFFMFFYCLMPILVGLSDSRAMKVFSFIMLIVIGSFYLLHELMHILGEGGAWRLVNLLNIPHHFIVVVALALNILWFKKHTSSN